MRNLSLLLVSTLLTFFPQTLSLADTTAPPLDFNEVRLLILHLDDMHFKVREEAAQRLRVLAETNEAIFPLLRDARKVTHLSPEAKVRVDALLSLYDPKLSWSQASFLIATGVKDLPLTLEIKATADALREPLFRMENEALYEKAKDFETLLKRGREQDNVFTQMTKKANAAQKALLRRRAITALERRGHALREYMHIYETLARSAGFKIVHVSAATTAQTWGPFKDTGAPVPFETSRLLIFERQDKFYSLELDERGQFKLAQQMSDKPAGGESVRDTVIPRPLLGKRATLIDSSSDIEKTNKPLVLQIALQGYVTDPFYTMWLQSSESATGSIYATDVVMDYFQTLYPDRKDDFKLMQRLPDFRQQVVIESMIM